VIQWLVGNVKGIGEVKATSLFDVLGEQLYDVLDHTEHSAIQVLIPSREVREAMFTKWSESGDAKTLRFMQDRDIPLDLARKVIKFHGKQTVEALIADPYRLLSFEGSWQRVEEIAREKFEVALDDPLRLAAALEESLYRVSAKGHTCTTLSGLRDTFAILIKPLTKPTAALAKAMFKGRHTGQFVCRERPSGDLMLYAPGTYIMEQRCADFVGSLLHNPNSQHLFPDNVDALLDAFDQEERLHLDIPSFALNSAQRAAVRMSSQNRFSIITGAAGVGKTTVLKALYKTLDTMGRPRFQMALSGRAAARMMEATQEGAMTIASFLRNVTGKDMGLSPVIIIDEASMLDLLTFHKLIQKLPANVHMILVGDPYQLPPIGAGLVLHVLCDLVGIPCTRLTEIKRQAKESAIPSASIAIRAGKWPAFSSETSAEIAFLRCDDDQIIETVLNLYEQDSENTQILCATRTCAFAGLKTINRKCHIQFSSEGRHLIAENAETGNVEETGFCVGDLLLYTVNDWKRNLQNGCLGKLIEVFDHPVKVNVGNGEQPDMRTALGRAVFEGVYHHILDSDVDVIEHAYAITVHKAQGSQFKRVIVPVRNSRVLDRTLIYTAVTRAQIQIILVGDVDAVGRAIARPPNAFSRQVGLAEMVASLAPNCLDGCTRSQRTTFG
jgi:exodeoxyribonuclease V alpha subunit